MSEDIFPYQGLIPLYFYKNKLYVPFFEPKIDALTIMSSFYPALTGSKTPTSIPGLCHIHDSVTLNFNHFTV